ncbi:antichymotrypsin-2-like isoform X2 [Pseudomyrmex gracilis]|nr:antichymotrypsin-2-like isoform X2 [Pseudomyrmex gracilis]
MQVDKKPSTTLKNVIPSCHDFTSSLYKTLSESSNDNILISPVNVYVLLSLLTHGTAGSTLDELRSILYHDDIVSLSEEFQSLIALLKDIEKVDLYTKSAIFAQYGYPFLNKFESTSTDIFDFFITMIDFSNAVKAVEDINTWIKRSTYNKLSNIITPDTIEEETRMMFVNTIYFNGKWLAKFDEKNTQMLAFHVSKTEINLVPTMVKKTKFNCGEIPEWKASFIEIPYMNSDFVMVILLPYEEVNLQTVENNFNWKILANAPRSVEEIELYLPKFNIDFTMDLKDILKKMGVITMFSKDANFTTMSSQPIYLSHVIQKGFLKVDEESTEAAAATVAQGRSIRSAPRIFAVERPFLFAIEYKPYKIPLLLGSVRKLDYQPLKDEL